MSGAFHRHHGLGNQVVVFDADDERTIGYGRQRLFLFSSPSAGAVPA
jgi:hypothetical protein